MPSIMRVRFNGLLKAALDNTWVHRSIRRQKTSGFTEDMGKSRQMKGQIGDFGISTLPFANRV